MSDMPPYPSSPEPQLPTHSDQPPPSAFGGYGTPPPPPPAPPGGGYGPPPTGPGTPQAYDVIAAVSYGWRAFTRNWGAFVLLGLLSILLPAAVTFVGSLIDSDGPRSVGVQFGVGFGAGGGLARSVVSAVAQILTTFFTAALIRAALDVTEGQPADIGAAFTRWDKGQVLVLSILVSIASGIGFFLCVLPGIAIVFFTWFATFFVVGQGLSFVDGIRSSVRFTADHIGNLILLFLLSVVIGIAGACACGVGLLVAVPVVTVAAAYTFKVLQGQPVATI